MDIFVKGKWYFCPFCAMPVAPVEWRLQDVRELHKKVCPKFAEHTTRVRRG